MKSIQVLAWGSFLLFVATVSMADETVRMTNSWSGSLSGGANITRGNSETMLYNGSALMEYKMTRHEFRIGAEVNYGENVVVQTNGARATQSNVDNAKCYAKYKWLFLGNAYLYGQFDLSRDDIAVIEYRLLVGPGLGFYLVKNDQNKLALEGGCSYLREKKSGIEDDKITLRLAQRYDLKLSETAKAWESIEYLPSFEDFADYLLNTEIGIETSISSAFSLKLTVQNKFNSRPAVEKKNSDLTAIASVNYKF